MERRTKKETVIRGTTHVNAEILSLLCHTESTCFEFEVGEATVSDTIKWVEETLIKDGTFSLPGKKVLLKDDSIEVVLVDVTECPVERPQKNNESTILEKRNSIQ